MVRLEDIEALDRKREPATSGGLCDLLWSDPIPELDDDKTLPEEGPPSPQSHWRPNDVTLLRVLSISKIYIYIYENQICIQRDFHTVFVSRWKHVLCPCIFTFL
jgi:hypothetical protein